MSITSPLTETPSIGKNVSLPALSHPEVVKNLPMMWQGERGRRLVESILKSHEINWPELRNEAFASRMPVPVYRKDSEIFREISQEAERLRASMIPIESTEMAGVMYRLQAHYWQPNMTESLARSRADDYVRLLGGYPQFAFEEAYDSWLRNPANKFFPALGEFEDLLKTKFYARKWRLQQLDKLIERAE